MSPRSSAADAARTRDRIVHTAVQEASVLGMEGLTIGGLAERLDMSKAGVVGPFGSRAELQAAALERAGDVFRAAVLDTVRERAPGPARLAALLDAWIGYLAECPFPGGCFVTAASSELDGRPGPLRDRLGAVVRHWRAYLSEEIAAAGTADRPADELATVLIGISMAVNQEIQLLDDPTAARRGRIAMRAAVGLPAE